MSDIDLKNDTEELERMDFEHQVVCKILRSGGVIGNIRKYVEEHQRLHIFPTLTLDWLRAKFPEFPVELVAVLFTERLPDWPQMFKCFTTTKLFRAYQRACEHAAVNDRHQTLGLVFNMDGITFVLHNFEPAISLPGRRIVRQLGNPPVTFAFEEFATLLACIDKVWASDPAGGTE